jgi:hypothetical protein
MADPEMRPDELAWAFTNAGRAPTAQQSTSEDFAARARAAEAQRIENLQRQQYQQDAQYNQTIHAQDMAAAQAQHRALMGQYTLLDQTRAELGAYDAKSEGWVAGLVTGLIAGSVLTALFWGKRS